MFKGHYAIVKYFYNIISGYTSPYLDVSQTNGTINPFLDFPNWLVSPPSSRTLSRWTVVKPI